MKSSEDVLVFANSFIFKIFELWDFVPSNVELTQCGGVDFLYSLACGVYIRVEIDENKRVFLHTTKYGFCDCEVEDTNNPIEFIQLASKRVSELTSYSKNDPELNELSEQLTKILGTVEVHKITISVLDFKKLGIEFVLKTLKENHPYLSPIIVNSETRTINNWSDEHPINKQDTFNTALNKLFSDE
jgi:hypothetical protein